jgi:hypothetical protein
VPQYGFVLWFPDFILSRYVTEVLTVFEIVRVSHIITLLLLLLLLFLLLLLLLFAAIAAVRLVGMFRAGQPRVRHSSTGKCKRFFSSVEHSEQLCPPPPNKHFIQLIPVDISLELICRSVIQNACLLSCVGI